MPRVLTDHQVERYHRDGFLVVEGFVERARCDELRAAAGAIVDAFDPVRRTVFTTNDQVRVSDADFLASGSGTWCFFEEEAFDDTGALLRPKELSINKIGHAMHDLDPTFEAFSYTPEIAGVAADVGLVDALALQSMYIFKQPHIGGEVGCHQDATFLWTDPVSVTGFWFAIEDATIDNGCLWAAPGGHRTALRRLFRRNVPFGDPGSNEGGTEMVVLDPAPLPGPEALVPLEVPAGTLVVLHGLLPHRSEVNRSPVSRHAYSLHCVAAGAAYPAWNWLQRPVDLPPRRLEDVAGVAA